MTFFLGSLSAAEPGQTLACTSKATANVALAREVGMLTHALDEIRVQSSELDTGCVRARQGAQQSPDQVGALLGRSAVASVT
jgi:hypothetical protein